MIIVMEVAKAFSSSFSIDQYIGAQMTKQSGDRYQQAVRWIENTETTYLAKDYEKSIQSQSALQLYVFCVQIPVKRESGEGSPLFEFQNR